MDELAALLAGASPTVMLGLLLFDTYRKYDALAQRLANIVEQLIKHEDETRAGYLSSVLSDSGASRTLDRRK